MCKDETKLIDCDYGILWRHLKRELRVQNSPMNAFLVNDGKIAMLDLIEYMDDCELQQTAYRKKKIEEVK
jgi:hypothetical protein